MLRDIALARAAGGRLHIQRVSTAAAVAAIRRGLERGVRITAEATPHHLLLTHDLLGDYGTEYKVSPPLRPAADVEAVQGALADGTIACVATDHAPRHYDEKEQAFDDAPHGVVGLETAFAVLHTRLVRGGGDGAPDVARADVAWARSSSGDRGGVRWSEGRRADLVLIDPAAEWVVDPARFLSKGRSTPFAGMRVTGRVVRTLVGGETVWSVGEDPPARVRGDR